MAWLVHYKRIKDRGNKMNKREKQIREDIRLEFGERIYKYLPQIEKTIKEMVVYAVKNPNRLCFFSNNLVRQDLMNNMGLSSYEAFKIMYHPLVLKLAKKILKDHNCEFQGRDDLIVNKE